MNTDLDALTRTLRDRAQSLRQPKSTTEICGPRTNILLDEAADVIDRLREALGDAEADVRRLHKDKCDAIEKLIAAGLYTAALTPETKDD